jgi:OmpA-OmpF porin, OOP family
MNRGIFLLLLCLAPLIAEAQATGKIRRSDRDGDGVKNKRDRCPDEAGPIYLRGCPDRDGDGIPDIDDLCPDQYGLEQYQGCPDTDGDGILDDVDHCPYEWGLPEFFGCPDRDGDGIPDKDDLCPDERGHPSAAGCPDRDGDGITDREDKCPNSAGPRERGGCPEIAEADLALLRLSIERLRFDAGDAGVDARGREYLDEVAQMLVGRYADYRLIIQVHTDTRGSADEMLRLSQRQAQAVAAYLTAKGVSPGRIETAGFGGGNPISNNLYPEGRARNRRVEMLLEE